MMKRLWESLRVFVFRDTGTTRPEGTAPVPLASGRRTEVGAESGAG